MTEELTKEIAYNEFQKFFQDKPFVLFGTGMSCAVDNKFGMEALEKELTNKLSTCNLPIGQQKEWNKTLEALSNDIDFESAMNSVNDDYLIDKIVVISGNFVSSLDFEYSQKILDNSINWPASSLFKKLVEGLPGTDRELHVATPNYDMLAEYAFSKDDIPYINGFYGGIVRHLDWEQSRRSITYVERIPYGKKFQLVTREHKHIALYKVHGSINLFKMKKNPVIENNTLLHKKLPKGTERVIVTPGLSKYEKLLNLRNVLLKNFDSVLKKHNFFLFLGFGFNDSQLMDDIIVKLKTKKCNGLIITKDPNDRIDNLLDEAENLWLICQSDTETLIKNKKYSTPLLIQNEELWKVDIFTKKILGG